MTITHFRPPYRGWEEASYLYTDVGAFPSAVERTFIQPGSLVDGLGASGGKRIRAKILN